MKLHICKEFSTKTTSRTEVCTYFTIQIRTGPAWETKNRDFTSNMGNLMHHILSHYPLNTVKPDNNEKPCSEPILSLLWGCFYSRMYTLYRKKGEANQKPCFKVVIDRNDTGNIKLSTDKNSCSVFSLNVAVWNCNKETELS